MKPSVIDNVVQHGISSCIGCGVCAALCPKGAIEMAWNKYGEYNPIEAKPCTAECNLCLKVCPFAENGDNEDSIGKELYSGVSGINHHQDSGYYLASHVGFAEKQRQSSASGGIVTWLLETLLLENIVDYVVCVASTQDPDRLFSFMVFNNPEGVRTGAGSAYYPVEVSGAIKHILDFPGRYAITGLPCFLKAIRLAQKRNAILRERIVVTVGLVCGQMKSKHFTDYIAVLAEARGKVTDVRYRGKSPDQPASNYHYIFATEDYKEHRIFWNDGISRAWTNRLFTISACNYCDDIFAECADVTCMDAWLPEYSEDSRGTSLVLVRSSLIEKIMAQGKGAILESIPIERVLQSQAGVIAIKRRQLAHRLYKDRNNGLRVPKKRVKSEGHLNPFLLQEVVLMERMRLAARDNWIACMPKEKQAQKAMQLVMWQFVIQKQLAKIITFPTKALLYAQKKIWRTPYE